MKLENFTGTWTFSRPGLGGRQTVNAKGLVEGDLLILAIEHQEQLFLKLRLQESALIGNYAFELESNQSTDNSIELNISDSGKCLQGFPKGFANLEHWTFERT
ncbi:MAG: hypothetical protein QGI45_00775 [Myxococcota bacterium]|jgi:hypothetical protein|nr:hypothetical protein [Myxococcota bacterium]